MMPKTKSNVLNLATTERMAMVGGRELLIESNCDSNIIRIIEPEGTASLTILITKKGPIVQLTGKSLMIEAEGDISFEAENISLHSRKTTTISSETDLSFRAEGTIDSKASEHSICSELGDVKVKANDDVKLNGERIKLNC
ncbi:MAG: hypothetical protein DRH15_06395 [Deltaproteobacteria bacterium]|nr:MAG: hypothetical protein DRH15_06395 [Deltaproteobacteria bacterium]